MESKATIAAFFLLGLIVAFSCADVVLKVRTGRCSHDRWVDRYNS